ncbi:MAG: RecX family transcriptional regulator [Acidobacteria bacterium]|nr:RecX family transcriptional regulator [Acidobacteriota bacterium]
MPFRKKTPKPKPVPDEKALYEIAVRALARGARSTGELRRLLEQRKAEKSDVDAVIARLREHGYLDDARYARSFVSSRIENDRQGARRVERDLAARRVHPEVIQKTVRAAYEEVDERELLRDYLRRKVRLTKPPQKASAVTALYRRLLRAGFSSATIVKELQGLLPGMQRGASSISRSGRASPALDPAKWQEWVESLSDLPEQEEED